MIARLINGFVSFMIIRGVIPDTEDQREIYSYGLELQIYYAIHAAVLLSIGLVFGRAFEMELLLFLFGLIQSNGGGYHANTHGKCLTLMVMGALLFLALFPLYQRSVPLQIMSVLVGLMAVVCLAPIAHKNHPLNPEKSKAMGKKAKYLACGISLLWCVLSFLSVFPSAQAVISITMAFSCASMVSAWVKKHVKGKVSLGET